MELEFGFWFFTASVGGLVAVCFVLKRANEWYHVSLQVGKQYHSLPPGDLGWPLIGNMLSFLVAFKLGRPDSFIANFVTRFLCVCVCVCYFFDHLRDRLENETCSTRNR